MEQQPKLAEEMKKMEWEPLAPVELSLVRWSIGGWTLDGVPPGEWREGVVGRMG